MQERITIRLIQERVAEHYGTTATLLCGSCRRRHLIEPRHLAMWLAYHLIGRSSTEIGNAFGKRDHTTVLYALKNAGRWTDGRSPDEVWDRVSSNPHYCGQNTVLINMRGMLGCRHVEES